MSKLQILDKPMTERDVCDYGDSLRMIDGTTYILNGRDCVHTITNMKRPISQCYSNIKNVKNGDGEIVGKRISPNSRLLFTNRAFQPIRKMEQTYKPQKAPRRGQSVRVRNTSGRDKKVSVLLSETGYHNAQTLKTDLLNLGASQVKLYKTSKGITVVCHPNYILEKLINKAK
ncbi:hypothetical protein ABU952_18840 [Bacillus amyloliquefaciens]|uniref:hypothetical protein n=1 Tax=Bacillus amyloliquefaciens TaxID=1390 RepID=UPI00336AFDBC